MTTSVVASSVDGTKMTEDVVSHNEFVLVFEKDMMSIDERNMPGLNAFQKEVPGISKCTSLKEGAPVIQPPNPSPGLFPPPPSLFLPASSTQETNTNPNKQA